MSRCSRLKSCLTAGLPAQVQSWGRALSGTACMPHACLAPRALRQYKLAGSKLRHVTPSSYQQMPPALRNARLRQRCSLKPQQGREGPSCSGCAQPLMACSGISLVRRPQQCRKTCPTPLAAWMRVQATTAPSGSSCNAFAAACAVAAPVRAQSFSSNRVVHCIIASRPATKGGAVASSASPIRRRPAEAKQVSPPPLHGCHAICT